MNRLFGKAYLFGFSITLFDARASLYGGTQYVNTFAKDLSGALDKVQRNVLGALDTLGRRLALLLRKFREKVEPFVERMEAFLRPVAQFAEDVLQYLDSLLDTFDISAEVLAFVEKCRKALEQIPIVKKFREILRRADEVFEAIESFDVADALSPIQQGLERFGTQVDAALVQSSAVVKILRTAIAGGTLRAEDLANAGIDRLFSSATQTIEGLDRFADGTAQNTAEALAAVVNFVGSLDDLMSAAVGDLLDSLLNFKVTNPIGLILKPALDALRSLEVPALGFDGKINIGPVWLATSARFAFETTVSGPNVLRITTVEDRDAARSALSVSEPAKAVQSSRVETYASALSDALQDAALVLPSEFESRTSAEQSKLLSSRDRAVQRLRRSWDNLRSRAPAAQSPICNALSSPLANPVLLARASDSSADALKQMTSASLAAVNELGFLVASGVDKVRAEVYEKIVDPALSAVTKARRTAQDTVRQADARIRPFLNRLDQGLELADSACGAVIDKVTQSVQIANTTLLETAGRLQQWVRGTIDSAGKSIATKLEEVA